MNKIRRGQHLNGATNQQISSDIVELNTKPKPKESIFGYVEIYTFAYFSNILTTYYFSN